MTRRMVGVLVFTVAAMAGGYWWTRPTTEAPEVRTATISRGPVVTTVSATGTTQAVKAVTVGTQVSGTVAWLGADFNTVVRKGQVIARLDPSLLEAQVAQAKASVTKASADRHQRAITLADRQAKLARADQLAARQLVAATDLEDARLAADLARTDVEAVDAQVSQAEASLRQATLNLSHATITAPIDGTVIDRSVDIGQTVAASLSSPTLFVIAADLTQMRATLSVDESDISQVAAGQPVTVTVSAYPGERFRGEVTAVRLQPVVASNVTSYTTIVDIANRDLKLKPGMTATAQIEVGRRDDVLRVPNAALRFVPSAAQLAAVGQTEAPPASTGGPPAATETRATVNGTEVVLASATVARPTTARPAATRGGGQIWILDAGTLTAVPVRIGLADGSYTEIAAADDTALEPGDTVVMSIITAATATPTASTPVSSMFSGNAGGRGMGAPR